MLYEHFTSFYCAHARTNIENANIKFPGYLEYTINFKYYFHRASGVYGGNTRMKRELREHIYIPIYMLRANLEFAQS